MKSPKIFPFVVAGTAGGLVTALVPTLIGDGQAQTKLLPFQGRLTDASGGPVPDGSKVVEFKMYDAPTGGAVRWAGEVHKLSINGGLVNTMLGSKASLGAVSPTYLQITVDANGDGQITAADPPLLPRQSVVGSVFAAEAGNSRRLGDHAAEHFVNIFAENDPSRGELAGNKIKAGSLPMSVFAPDSITSAQIGPGQVTSSELAAGSVGRTGHGQSWEDDCERNW